MMQDLINSYIHNPNSFENNIVLALKYEEIGQLGSAVSHYLKAADLAGQNKNHSYLAVSGTARCFIRAGGREGTVDGLLKRALALSPNYSAPYVELAKYYEIKKQWHDCYMISSIGIINCKPIDPWLIFFKAVAAWWIGNTEESRELIYCLWVQGHKLTADLKNLVYSNLYSIDEPYAHNRYKKEYYNALKRKFPGIKNIQTSYSQCHQDLFAALVANGKKNGFYLEIGSGDPEHNNNTCMLERSLDWDGISIDINFSATQKFRALRNNSCYMINALHIDYNVLLQNAPKVIDYLQIDIDPPQTLSLDVLYKIPFDKYIFRAITFEHNDYETSKDNIKQKSREFLSSKGYKLAVSDIAVRENRTFEDWWIHNSVEDFSLENVDISEKPKTSKSYFYDLNKFENLHLTFIENWINI